VGVTYRERLKGSGESWVFVRHAGRCWSVRRGSEQDAIHTAEDYEFRKKKVSKPPKKEEPPKEPKEPPVKEPPEKLPKVEEPPIEEPRSL
jgi:hypothetical protein